MERAEEALGDPELVALLEDIALIEALMIDRLEQLGEESHAQLWSRAIDLHRQLNDQKAEGGLAMEPEAGALFDALGEVLVNGQGRAQAEREIIGFQEHRRKMADTEIKRQHTLNQFMTAKQANVLLAVLLSIIKESVKDRSEREAVGTKLVGVFRQSLSGSALG